MPSPNTRSMISISSVMPMTGVASTWISAVEYSAHTNSGMRKNVMPGGRSLWIVTMKFSPVKTELKPSTKAPKAAGTTAVSVVVL
jgi:hypothetical protein